MSIIRRLFERILTHEQIDILVRKRYAREGLFEPFPRGHFYSPLPDYEDVEERQAILFEREIDVIESVDLNTPKQLDLVRKLAALCGDFCWQKRKKTEHRFYLENNWFGEGDALSLYFMMRHFRPKRIIEIGSGYSSALMLDVNEHFLDHSISFSFIEPFPENRLNGLLRMQDHESCKIKRARVQDLPLSLFLELEANDILFVDSSHVSKIGSDVNYIVFDILPRLPRGVIVHFHDIIWPFEYPKQWIMEGRAWNEAYLLRAFLQYNREFEILLFNSYLGYRHASTMEELVPLFMENSGGSLWMVRK